MRLGICGGGVVVPVNTGARFTYLPVCKTVCKKAGKKINIEEALTMIAEDYSEEYSQKWRKQLRKKTSYAHHEMQSDPFLSLPINYAIWSGFVQFF